MIYEHEIPKGSHLYFGKSAKLKREIENLASKILEESGFEEIVTPNFSYQHYQCILNDKELIKLSDTTNSPITLRADSTFDVVRLITKRLGRHVNHNKWYYIQPIFRYPTIEEYQIGAEWLESGDLKQICDILISIFKNLNLNPILQIANIKIPKILSKELDIPLFELEDINLDRLFSKNIKWLERILYLQYPSQIDSILDDVPDSLKIELEKLRDLAKSINYSNIIISPMYYTKLTYYDEMFFKFFENNRTFAKGGNYKIENLDCIGFGINTDKVIQTLLK